MRYNNNTKKWESEFWHPSVATDAVVFGFSSEKGALEILLIQRGVEPFKGAWALPGGFLKEGESAEECVSRELKEETHLENIYFKQIGAFSDPKRDEGHEDQVISISFVALVTPSDYEVIGDDDALKAVWFPVKNLPELAFDHKKIIAKAQEFLREKIVFESFAFSLLDEEFTIPQLQQIYEAIFDAKFDRRNFQKKMLSLGYIVNTGKKVKGTPYKAPTLYQFDERKYEQVYLSGTRLLF